MAMEDSLVLAEELRNAKSVESALESYVRRRRPRADWVQDRIAPRRRPGSFPQLREMRRCASVATRCSATATDLSFPRRSRFRIETLLWEGLPA